MTTTVHTSEKLKNKIQDRFPDHFSRRERKKWVSYEKKIAHAYNNKHEKTFLALKEEFIAFVKSKGINGCPIIIKSSKFLPSEALLKKVQIGGEILEVWKCPKS